MRRETHLTLATVTAVIKRDCESCRRQPLTFGTRLLYHRLFQFIKAGHKTCDLCFPESADVGNDGTNAWQDAQDAI
jgi:hypothetical protein